MIRKYLNLFVLVISYLSSSNLLSAEIADSNANDILFPICVDNKVGYIDISGKIIIEPKYDTKFHKSTINLKDKELESIFFPQNAYFSEGKATVRIGKWFLFIPLWYEYAVLDAKTKNVFLTDYFEPGTFINGIAIIRVPKRSFAYEYQQTYSYMKTDGSIDMTKRYIYAGKFNEGKAVVLNMENHEISKEAVVFDLNIDKYGYINPDLKYVIEPQFSDAGDFSEGLAYVKYGDNYGFINENNELLIDTVFKRVWNFKNGFARVFDGEQYWYIDKSGKNVFDKKFILASDFSEGVACIKVDSKVRYIDTKGDFLFEKSFSDGLNFKDGLAGVENALGKWGFIDKKGEYVIDHEFDYVESFQNGLAHAWKNGKMYYINRNADIVSEVFFEK
jgi:hypothetical protein